MNGGQNRREVSIYLSSFSLAVFVVAKLAKMMGITGLSIITMGMVTTGIVFGALALILSFVYSISSALTPETRRMVTGLQLATVIVIIVSLLTGGFGSFLAGYIHF